MRKDRICSKCRQLFRPRPERGPLHGDYCASCREMMGLWPKGALDTKEATLKGALNRALRKVDDLKAHREELVQAVYRAASDAAASLELPPVPAFVAPKQSGTPESAVAVLADWQLGKVTPDYNTEVLEGRVHAYASALERVTQIQRSDHPVKELAVYLLGDIVEGELIFPGQAHRIDSSLFTQVLSAGPRILGGFLRRMLRSFEKVRVVGVIGNHGRLGGQRKTEYHPESNADAMLYEVTRLVLKDEPRLTWAPNLTPGERHWFALDEVQGHTFFLFHGDQIKTPLYANVFEQAVLGWQDIYGFDYALSGHYHKTNRMKIGSNATHWAAGTLESTNTFAAEFVKRQSTPSQWALFVHPRRGVSAEYEVRV